MENKARLMRLATCAGCGAKVGAGVLAELLGGHIQAPDPNLLVGFDSADDACVYRINETLALVQTLDFFPPIADDPYLFGQIAATNALSDIYAMGGEPKLALNILCIPKQMPQADVQAILAGGREQVAAAGAMIAGGHSIYDETPKYGLSVTGFVNPSAMLRNIGAQEGDLLLLTKPLGVGVILSAAKADMAEASMLKRAYAQMTALNRHARDCLLRYRVHACTDVTGFGLLGHLLEMTQGSAVTAEIWTDRVPVIEGAAELAQIGLLPEGMYRNREFAEAETDIGKTPLYLQDLLFDPQTSGGLLAAVHPDDAARCLSEIGDVCADARLIGRIERRADKAIRLENEGMK